MTFCVAGRWGLFVLFLVNFCLMGYATTQAGTETLVSDAAVSSHSLALPSREDRPVVRSQMATMQISGLTPDDGIDDSQAFSEECTQACLSGCPLWLLPGTYDIDKNITITCSGDLTLVGMEGVHINLDGFLTFRADTADDMILLREDVPRGGRSIVVDDTSRCSVGDLICIDTAVIAESAWKTPKREVHRIEEVPDGTTLRFEEPLVFTYGVADEGLAIRAYKRRQITIVNIAFDVNDHQLATQYFSGGTVLGNCRWTERDEGEQDGYLYSPGWSVGVIVSDATFEGGYYGCIPACSRDVTFERIKGHRCAGHVIAPNNWCYGVYVRKISGSECGSLVDSHPSFEVHYNNVRGQIKELPNLRSLGGSIRNYVVESTKSDSGALYFQNVDLLVDKNIYDETTLVLENFTLTSPNRDSSAFANRAVFLYGYRAILNDVNWSTFDFYPGPMWGGPRNGFHEVEIVGCNMASLYLWGGQQAIIDNSHFISGTDGVQRNAISVNSASSYSVANTTFTGYSGALSVFSTEPLDFTACRFTNCDTVFTKSDVVPKVTFDHCEFRADGSWGGVDTRNLRISGCTFEWQTDGDIPPSVDDEVYRP